MFAYDNKPLGVNLGGMLNMSRCTYLLKFHFNHFLKHTGKNKVKRNYTFFVIVPIPLVGEELYTQMGFLFRQFWSINIFIVEIYEGYH